MNIALSFNNVPVRLTRERWLHISLGHPEMAAFYDEILETVENPENVYQGIYKELLAVKRQNNDPSKFIVVVYKEVDKDDGFIITSFITNKEPYFKNKKIIWKR